MDPAFWHERWARKEIGFHRSSVHPMLETHWAGVAGASREAVLVPLCGKSLDLEWLARGGHAVVGVELSASAVREYFEERGRTPRSTTVGGLPALASGGVTLCIGDFFAFRPGHRFSLVYDRAAMIALPAIDRPSYRTALRELVTADARGLLVTLEYRQREMDGPPFSVSLDELEGDPAWRFETIAARDALPDHPGFAGRGLTSLTERALRLTPS